jgi:hypothetical protein
MSLITPTSGFEQIVKDKIRSTLLDTIPDEQIDELIKSEWAALFEPTSIQKGTKYNYDTKEYEPVIEVSDNSAFDRMVKKELSEQLEAMVKAKIKSIVDELSQDYDHETGRYEMRGTFVDELSRKLAPEMVNNFVKAIASDVFMTMQNRQY